MHSIKVAKGDVIFTEGSLSSMFYIVISGRFEVSKLDSKGHNRLLDTLGPNQFFGEMGLLTGEPRTATITALGPGELNAFLPDEFEALIAKKPETMRPLLRVMAKRLQTS